MKAPLKFAFNFFESVNSKEGERMQKYQKVIVSGPLNLLIFIQGFGTFLIKIFKELLNLLKPLKETSRNNIRNKLIEAYNSSNKDYSKSP